MRSYAILAWLACAALLLAAREARSDGVRSVRTAQELQAAFGDGVKHVVINEHLDLTGLSVFAGVGLDDGVLATTGFTQTVRVRHPGTLLARRACANGLPGAVHSTAVRFIGDCVRHCVARAGASCCVLAAKRTEAEGPQHSTARCFAMQRWRCAVIVPFRARSQGSSLFFAPTAQAAERCRSRELSNGSHRAHSALARDLSESHARRYCCADSLPAGAAGHFLWAERRAVGLMRQERLRLDDVTRSGGVALRPCVAEAGAGWLASRV